MPYLAKVPRFGEDVAVLEVGVMVVGLRHAKALMANKTEKKMRGRYLFISSR